MSWLRAEVTILGGLALAAIGVASEVLPTESWLHGYSRAFYVLAVLWWIMALLHWAFSGMRSRSRKRVDSPTGAGKGHVDTSELEIDVHVRVYRAISETGNAASEPYRRWLHLVAENWSSAPLKDARVSVRIQGRDYGGGWQEWYWTDAREVVTSSGVHRSPFQSRSPMLPSRERRKAWRRSCIRTTTIASGNGSSRQEATLAP